MSGGTLDVQGGYINQSWMRGTGATVIDPSVDLPEDSKGTLLLNADALNRMGLGSILASATEDVTVDSAFGVTPGGKRRASGYRATSTWWRRSTRRR